MTADTIARRARRLSVALNAMPAIERRALRNGDGPDGDARRALIQLKHLIDDAMDETKDYQEGFDA